MHNLHLKFLHGISRYLDLARGQHHVFFQVPLIYVSGNLQGSLVTEGCQIRSTSQLENWDVNELGAQFPTNSSGNMRCIYIYMLADREVYLESEIFRGLLGIIPEMRSYRMNNCP